MTKFFKKSRKLYFGAFRVLFYPNLGKKTFSWKKGLCQFLYIPKSLPSCKKSEKNNDGQFLKKCRTSGRTDRQTDGRTYIYENKM